jgi:Zn-dependent peptidase ImmA (M78 family)
MTATSEYFRSASQLLDELGITSPDDIDVEAIAFHCGARIKYRALSGCAARIVGNGHSAIITIDSNSPRGRQRFSAGHELGHWMYDRGKASLSCNEQRFVKDWSKNNPESRANSYASDLLLPVNIFKPMTATLKSIDLTVAAELATRFQMSLTATAIRLVEHGPLPSMLVCYSASGREWFVRNPDVSKSLWPMTKPNRESYAYDLLNGSEESSAEGDVSASAWFEHELAERYPIHEHSIRAAFGDVLSLIWWKDERMLIAIDDYEERQDARRSDDRFRR